MTTLNGRLSRLEAALNQSMVAAGGRDEHGRRSDREERWLAAYQELTATMAPEHVEHVNAGIERLMTGPDDADFDALTRAFWTMLEQASGYVPAPWRGPFVLPQTVAEVLLSDEHARLDHYSECAQCGYLHPHHSSYDGKTLHRRAYFDQCAVCGCSDVGLMRYRTTHNYQDAPVWEPSSE